MRQLEHDDIGNRTRLPPDGYSGNPWPLNAMECNHVLAAFLEERSFLGFACDDLHIKAQRNGKAQSCTTMSDRNISNTGGSAANCSARSLYCGLSGWDSDYYIPDTNGKSP